MILDDARHHAHGEVSCDAAPYLEEADLVAFLVFEVPPGDALKLPRAGADGAAALHVPEQHVGAEHVPQRGVLRTGREDGNAHFTRSHGPGMLHGNIVFALKEAIFYKLHEVLRVEVALSFPGCLSPA